MLNGSCLCGQVHYAIDGAVQSASHCYCSMCQKQHGAACGTYLIVADTAFRYTRGEQQVTRFVSSPGVQRSFCGRCGSTLTWVGADFPGVVGVTPGTLDNPYDTPVTRELFPEQKPAWRPRG